MSIEYARQELGAVKDILDSLMESKKLRPDHHAALTLHLDTAEHWLDERSESIAPLAWHDDTCPCFDCWKARYRLQSATSERI